MLSKNKIKFINALSLKKFRDENGLFIAEGHKSATDLATGFTCETLILTEAWQALADKIKAKEVIIAGEEELKKASGQKAPQGVLAIFRKNHYDYDPQTLKDELSLALDDVQDPGNLGTIIRIADWFGIRNIFCSGHTADAYAPKVVQASMGALARVKVHYTDLEKLLSEAKEVPVYGTFLEGKNLYKETLTPHGIIVMGNEGNGISPDIEKRITRKLFIPDFAGDNATSESLNVAIATSIVCSEFRRRL